MPVIMKPTSVIEANLGINPNGRVHKFFTETCYRYMDKYVPKDTGALRDTVSLKTDSITYEQPYAYSQYIGIVNGGEVKKYTTLGTGPYWDKRMVSAEMGQVMQEVQNYVDRRK